MAVNNETGSLLTGDLVREGVLRIVDCTDPGVAVAEATVPGDLKGILAGLLPIPFLIQKSKIISVALMLIKRKY
jgi:hypothetical protein